MTYLEFLKYMSLLGKDMHGKLDKKARERFEKEKQEKIRRKLRGVQELNDE